MQLKQTLRVFQQEAELRQLRKRESLAMPHCPTDRPLDLMECLTKQELIRLEQHRRDPKRVCGPDGSSFVDIAQTPSFSRGGPYFPTFTKNMLICDLGFIPPRLVTSNEMYLSQGHAVPGLGLPRELTDDFAWPGKYLELGRVERIKLLGNAQHMSTTGAWFLYCLSNIMPVGMSEFRFDAVAEDQRGFGTAVVDLTSEVDEAAQQQSPLVIDGD